MNNLLDDWNSQHDKLDMIFKRSCYQNKLEPTRTSTSRGTAGQTHLVEDCQALGDWGQKGQDGIQRRKGAGHRRQEVHRWGEGCQIIVFRLILILFWFWGQFHASEPIWKECSNMSEACKPASATCSCWNLPRIMLQSGLPYLLKRHRFSQGIMFRVQATGYKIAKGRFFFGRASIYIYISHIYTIVVYV